MTSDRDIALRALDFQKRAKEYALTERPGYEKWSALQLVSGVSEALIAHLDSMSMTLLPEEVPQVSTSVFDELLGDVKDATGGSADV